MYRSKVRTPQISDGDIKISLMNIEIPVAVFQCKQCFQWQVTIITDAVGIARNPGGDIAGVESRHVDRCSRQCQTGSKLFQN